MAKKRVIYVERSKKIAQTAKIFLEAHGYTVDIALSGKEGLRAIRSNSYDIAVLDATLPDICGWDLFQKTKSNNVKTALSSPLNISNDRVSELKKEGIAGYITKPFNKRSLVSKMREILRK